MQSGTKLLHGTDEVEVVKTCERDASRVYVKNASGITYRVQISALKSPPAPPAPGK